jgi:glycosyltransferase involved in cell wall biosynthesis
LGAKSEHTKIGVITSPGIRLASVFFYDYQLCIEDLTFKSSVYFLGSFQKKPNVQGSFSIENNKMTTLQLYTLFSLNFYKPAISFTAFPPVRSISNLIYKSFYDSKMMNYCHRFFDKNEVDVFYAFPLYPDRFYENLQKKYSKPLILEFWDDHVLGRFFNNIVNNVRLSTAEVEKRIGYEWMRRICTSARHVVVPTKILRNRLVSLGINSKNISVIPVCSDLPTSYPKSNSPKTKNILFIGSASVHHDVKVICDAMREVTVTNAELIIVGGFRKGQARIRKYMLDNPKKIKYKGVLSRDQVDQELANADVCIAPFKTFWHISMGFFPHKILQYALAGKAIITTKIPETEEMFEGVENACIFVPEGDVSQMAKALDTLLNDEELCLKLGEKAREFATKNYLWRRHTNDLFGIIESF